MKVIPSNFAADYASRDGATLLLAVVGRDLRRLYDEAPPPAVSDELAAILARLEAPEPART